MYVTYHEAGDVLMVQFRAPVGERRGSRDAGDGRFVESDDAGPLLVEFLGASHGITLDDLPNPDAIARALLNTSQVILDGASRQLKRPVAERP